MIYLDSAATSMQKPESVHKAVLHAMRFMASPGRGGHRASLLASDTVFKCRSELAELFCMDDLENVVFTQNATHALNIAIHSIVNAGDNVVISGYEHNAVTRPLRAIGANVMIAESPLFDEEAAVQAFREKLSGVSCAICAHTSNVFGFILPIERIAKLCRDNCVPLIVDASQSAGSSKLDFPSLGAKFAATAGHKGLLGPQGTGVLMCADTAKPLISGGTGSDSMSNDMPDYLPDRLEAGTHNVPGIAGLLEGLRYVRRRGLDAIMNHERRMMNIAADGLAGIYRVKLFCAHNPVLQSGVLSLTVDGADCDVLAEELGKCDVAVRAGLHCAPTAHKTAGTIDTGTVRLSFSPFCTESEVFHAISAIGRIIKKM